MYLAEIFRGKNKSYYLYDALTNQVTLLNSKLHNYLVDDVLRNENTEEYKYELKNHYLRNPFIEEKFNVKFYLTNEELKWHLDNKLEMITLNLTEECNMRCQYCAYYDKYENPKKNDENMSLDIAILSIEYLLKHSLMSSHIGIGFYGGESLMCFETIKKCIDYSIKNQFGHNITYHVYTNGLLLKNAEIRDYLIKNNIYVCVSLDGPQKLHDRYRRTINNNDTYIDIIDCLKSIQKSSPSYFDNNVCFNVVVSPPYSQKILYDFFEDMPQYARMIPLSITEHFKSVCKNWGYDNIEPDFDIFSFPNMRKSILRDYNKFHNPANFQYNHNVFPTGTCIPGVKRIFVRNNGDILICEKVDENNPTFKIGNITSGINFMKIQELLNQYIKIVTEKCSTCWAAHLCPVCFKEMEIMETKNCDIMRQRIKKDYETYLYYVFGNEEICKYFDNLKIG